LAEPTEIPNNKQQTAVEWFNDEILIHLNFDQRLYLKDIFNQAKEMEKEQIGYTKADVIKAGEMGEINYLDTLHITTYLDEAKKFNETYGGNK
jgi:hypothetical protein